MPRYSLVLAAMLAAGATGAAAGSRSIADCETIQGADAYNRCLASFGPTAGGSRGRVEPASERDYAPAHEQARHRRHGYGAFTHGHRGRVRMVLTPGRGH